MLSTRARLHLELAVKHVNEMGDHGAMTESPRLPRYEHLDAVKALLIDRVTSAEFERLAPEFVDLLSFWVYKIVRDENIPHALRYQTWPIPFNSKAGLQPGCQTRGRARRVFDDERDIWRYPIVFITLQPYGEVGEKAGLKVADLIPGRTHNKHTVTFGGTCVTKNNSKVLLCRIKPSQ